jgi:hypothetical protein
MKGQGVLAKNMWSSGSMFVCVRRRWRRACGGVQQRSTRL